VTRSRPVDGFALRYAHHAAGAADPVVLLHGWPGDHGDWAQVVESLAGRADVVVPDLRGFGRSDKHRDDPAAVYSAAAQCDSVLGLIDELGLDRPVVAGYDVGSRVARQLATVAPARLRGLVLAPPLPGAGDRVLTPEAQREFWYQGFHQLALAEQLVDGDERAVRAYLAHFWSHWSGPGYTVDPVQLDRLVTVYGPPGAFTASIGWYRAGAGAVATALGETPPARADRIASPTRILWPEHDPLFPRAWGDRLDEFFADAAVQILPGVGHFSPLEAPDAWATAILDVMDRSS
jgi:pimeloyl-ACP methyl ester carboxylesterase